MCVEDLMMLTIYIYNDMVDYTLCVNINMSLLEMINA